jgi:hypothetical protein
MVGTKGMIREANVAALSTLRVGHVDVVLGQMLLAIMPFVEAWRVGATLRLGKAVQKGEDLSAHTRIGGLGEDSEVARQLDSLIS